MCGNASEFSQWAFLHCQKHVFDVEAVGAWQGLRQALNDPTLRMRRLWMCIDSTSVIWCLRGNASSSSQWAFLRCQEAMGIWGVRVRWSPGHMGIEGNEVVVVESRGAGALNLV